MVEVCSLEEVTYWAKKGCLGSDPDPTEPGVANLIVAFSISPWPCTLWFGQGACCPEPENVFHNRGRGVSQGTF